MGESLKDKNKYLLFGIVAANLAVYYAAVQNDTIVTGDWSGLVQGVGNALPAGFGLVLIGIINAQISAETKSRIVFMRWRNPLPGCEAFTRLASADPRIDLSSIQSAYGPLPTDPLQQNALWYKMYKSVETDPSVIQVHRDYLLTRDYTGLSLMMAIVLGAAGFIQIPSAGTAVLYFALLLVQFILSSRSARNHGRRFVTTVLALKGAGR